MFNYNTLEQDIEKLGKEVGEKKNSVDYKQIPEREIIKQTITPFVLQAKQSVLQQAQTSQDIQGQKEIGVPDYVENLPAEIKLKVEKLMESVFKEGLEETLKKAASSDAFTLDALHDALTDKLHDELKKRSLL